MSYDAICYSLAPPGALAAFLVAWVMYPRWRDRHLTPEERRLMSLPRLERGRRHVVRRPPNSS